MKTKYYKFSQNNTGGSFDVDDKICHRLFIEAESAKEATTKAIELGVYFNGCDTGSDCPCCGDRWYHIDESDFVDLESISKSYKTVFNTVSDYAQHLADKHGWTTPDARIFHLNGDIEEINKSDK